MYTTLQKIEIAKVSQYLCANDIQKKGLFGGGVDLQLPNKIYCVRKNVEWMYNMTPVEPETEATASITIDAIGFVGDTITVYVNDPELGIILLGSYTQTALDINTTTLAENINIELLNNSYGYGIEWTASTIDIIARPGLGSSINGNNLIVELYSYLISEGGYGLITEGGEPIITES